MADVILVEDNLAISKAYSLALQNGGHRVRVAGDEPDLRRLLAESLPDLLLLDVGLPGIDGLEVLRSLREDAETRALRVAVLSNYTDRDLVHRALKLDAIEYVEKAALTPTLLLAQVNRWLER